MKSVKTIAAAAAVALVAAAPVAADSKKVAADPFASTQGLELGLGLVAATTVIIIVAAASDT